MNEEEIIKYIENVINTIKESDMLFDEPANISCGVRMAGALKGILNLYNQEKEKNKKLEEEKEAFARSYAIVRDEEADNYFLMSKVIDRMAKQISCLSRNLDNATNFERVSEEEYNVDFIKQYYFKKARGEEE